MDFNIVQQLSAVYYDFVQLFVYIFSLNFSPLLMFKNAKISYLFTFL